MLNVKNRTLFHGDNLDFLSGINSNTIDLIATDPPFNKGKDFHATPNSISKGASFQDRWSWEKDVHEEWLDQLQDDWPNVYNIIQMSRSSYGNDMGAFLCFLAVRLTACKRVLKDTGSIYLHCDPTASHYIKMLMDAIFGKENFRNEIVWHYRHVSSTRKHFLKKHDIIFWYSKTKNWTFNADNVRESYDEQTIKRYKTKVKFPGGYIAKPNDIGRIPYDVWQIPLLRNNSKERTGYPTQKPLKLYERIIKASSNEGDIVLDPFCGCATTCVAAEKLKRKWIGMDIWDGAYEVTVIRLKKEGFLATDDDERPDLISTSGHLTYTKTPPIRTDDCETSIY